MTKTNTKTSMLRAKRAFFDFSQTDVAQKLGITIVTYGRKERGELDFTQTDICILKEMLQLTNEEICEIFFD